MQRLLLPIVVPASALLVAVTLILSVGLLLLWAGDFRWEGKVLNPVSFVRLTTGDHERSEIESSSHEWEPGKRKLDLGVFTMSAPVVVALLVAVGVLAGATIASRGGGGRQG